MLDVLNNPIVDWLNDYASQGVLVTDANFVIRGWNRWLEQRSGREAADIIGTSLFESFPEISSRGLDLFYREALNGHAQLLAQRFHGYLIDLPTDFAPPFSRMRQTAWIAPLTDDGIVGTITLIEDVTERVLREAELSAARDEAETANQAKDALLATLSHDLRTPLTSVLGWIRMLRDRPEDADTLKRAITSIEHSALVQVQLIDQILDMSRLASGKMEVRPAEMDLVSLVEASIDAVTPMAESKEIRIEKRMPAKPQLCVLDSKRIHQIAWNLMSNAVKFTPRKGKVQISLQLIADRVQLKITDTGVGIQPENLNKVFKPLWQAENAGGHGGLGLGLAIAKQLAELHGGSIVAESAGLGSGTTFTVELPRSCEPQNTLHTGTA